MVASSSGFNSGFLFLVQTGFAVAAADRAALLTQHANEGRFNEIGSLLGGFATRLG